MRKATHIRECEHLEQVPNVGASIAGDLRGLGILRPSQLSGRDPYQLYDEICLRTGVRHDPCVLDTFIAAVRFAEGGPSTPWWHYTAERKRVLAMREVLVEARGHRG